MRGDAKYALLFGGLGVVQGVGLLLLTYDLLVPRYTLKRRANISVDALASSDGRLLVVKGRF